MPALRRAAYIVVLLLLVTGVTPASGQPGSVRFRHLTVEDGLSQNNALAIAQDTMGFLWIGTQDGLNRYDGYEFVTFAPDPDDPGSITHNYTNALLVDSGGTLWIGSRGGLHRYHAETQSFTNYHAGEDSLPDANVLALAEDPAGGLWIGTERGGISHFDPVTGRFTQEAHDPASEASLGSNKVTALAVSDEGKLWLGTERGLELRLGPGRYRHYGPQDGLGTEELPVRSLLLRDGVLMVGTRNGLFSGSEEGFERLDGEKGRGLAHETINAFKVDRNGHLWIATSGGLTLWAGEQAAHYRHRSEDPFSLAGDDVRAVFEDATGVIWVGLDGKGIDKIDPRGMGFAHLGVGLDHPSGEVFPHVWAILVDSLGELWVGTDNGGVSHYLSGEDRFEHFLARPQDADWLGTNHINSIIEDDRGEIWIGGDLAGLHRYDRESGRFDRYTHDPERPESLADDNVYAILEDRRNYLWVATDDGLDRLGPHRRRFAHFRHVPDDPSTLSDSGVRALFEASDGSIWVGTRRGLNRVDPLSGRVERISGSSGLSPGLGDGWIMAIQEAQDGLFWIGTTRGLVRFRPASGETRHYDQKDGLPNNVIYSVLIDANGRLWMSTNRGIAMLDPDTDQIESFDASHGLQANEFNQGAYFRDPSGRLYFGGLNGITAFHPNEITRDPTPPRVVITDFRLFNRSVPISSQEQPTPLKRHVSVAEEIVLGHEESVFTFDFAALHFADPGRNQYAYRLRGLSDDWIATTANRRSATFTALPAGSYTFQVRGSNRTGVWSSDPAQIRLSILPPPWRTIWAYGAYAGVLLVLGSIVTRAQVSKLATRRRAQERVAQSEERLRMALWGSGDELWDWNLRDGRITRLNRLDGPGDALVSDALVTEDMTDLDALAERVHPDDYPVLRSALQEHLAGRSDHFQVTCRVPDEKGEWTWVIERGRVVERDGSGQPLRIAGTAKDISPLKAAEEALMELNERLEDRVAERTDALQQANRELTDTIRRLQQTQSQLTEAEKMASLGSLVAGVAHEINTPVGVSVTAASHLVEQTRRFRRRLDESETIDAGDLAGYQKSTEACSDLILRNLERAAQLISSFKQVAVDQSSERRREFELATYLEEIHTSLRPRIDPSGHEVHIECARGIIMNTYPGALYQVVANLIINSLTHAYPEARKGVLELSVGQLDGGWIRLTYQDDGTGLSDEVRRRIFDPFFTTRRGSGGSGLGMHIVFNLVTQALHGSITCRNRQQGPGACFIIDLPLEPMEKQESIATSRAPS